MDPTRPIDSKKPTPSLGLKGVASSAAAAATAEASTRSATRGDDGDAASIALSTQAWTAGEARRLDTQRMQALALELAEDRYQVDPEALARRIVDDALGPEGDE